MLFSRHEEERKGGGQRGGGNVTSSGVVLVARELSITKITTGCTTVVTRIPEGFDRPRARPTGFQKRIVRPFKLGLSYSYARRVDTAPRVCIAIHCCDKLCRTLAPSQCHPRSVPFERGPPLGTRRREWCVDIKFISHRLMKIYRTRQGNIFKVYLFRKLNILYYILNAHLIYQSDLIFVINYLIESHKLN